MPDINRHHVAAALRFVAGEATAAVYERTVGDLLTEAEAELIVAHLAARLRQRADEIEGRA